MDQSTPPEDPRGAGTGAVNVPPDLPALVIAWCRDEPARVGEVVTVPPGASVAIGRGSADAPPTGPFGRHRPGVWLPSPPFRSRAISRRQLTVRALDGERLHVVNEGRCALLYRGLPVDEAECVPGDLLQLGQQLLLLCTRRPDRLPGDPDFAARFEPGEPDPHGIVGESPAAWALRARLADGVELPGLGERLEDVPLLVAHSLRAAARLGHPAALRLVPGAGPGVRPRVPLALVRGALAHRYTGDASKDVRELEEMVNQFLAQPAAPGDSGAVAEWASADDSSVVSAPHALDIRRKSS